MYGRLFAWIVSKANALLKPRGAAYERSREIEGGISEVGILDIFGFENFANNSFEQFCINTANEQLQYYFNQHIFAWEQALYEEEALPLSSIKYKDNGGLLDMVLGKPLGLFALLDEESNFPRATPASLHRKFLKARDSCGSKGLSVPESKAQRRPTIALRGKKGDTISKGDDEKGFGPFFVIHHYAGKVTYDCHLFLEKNRDTLSQLGLFYVCARSPRAGGKKRGGD